MNVEAPSNFKFAVLKIFLFYDGLHGIHLLEEEVGHLLSCSEAMVVTNLANGRHGELDVASIPTSGTCRMKGERGDRTKTSTCSPEHTCLASSRVIDGAALSS